MTRAHFAGLGSVRRFFANRVNRLDDTSNPPRSRQRAALEQATRPLLENLENRILLAINPVISTISDSAMLGTAIHVDAVSSNFDGQSPQNLEIQWDFGDVDSQGRDQNHNRMRGFNAAHLYTAAGTYTIGLSITDSLGVVSLATHQVTITPDTRDVLVIDSQAKVNALYSVASDTRVEFVGSAYSLGHQILLNSNVVVTSANPDGSRTRLNASDGLWSFFKALGSNVTVGELSLDTPSRAGTTGNTGTARAMEAASLKQNLTLVDCELLNLNTVFDGNSKPQGVLFQDNVAPLAGGLRDYFTWTEGSRWTYLGNLITSAAKAFVATGGNASLINVSDNTLGVSQGLGLSYGPDHIFVGGNHFTKAATASSGEFDLALNNARWIRVERNLFTQAQISIRAGTSDALFTQNLINFTGSGGSGFELNGGHDAALGLTVTDVTLRHNTILASGGNHKGFWLRAPGTDVLFEANLFDAAGMTMWAYGNFGMQLDVSSLSQTMIQNNAWVLPQSGYAGVYHQHNWSTRTPAQWTALVPGDTFHDTYAAAAASGAGVAEVPTVDGAASVDEGVAYTLNLNSGGWEASKLRWLIDWGDGTIEQINGPATSATHSYADAGGYSIRTIVNDGIGDYGLEDVAVTVQAVQPAVSVRSNQTVNVDDTFPLELIFACGGGNTPVVDIDWGDGSVSSAVVSEANGIITALAWHSYATEGVFNASVSIGGGCVASIVVPLTSTGTAPAAPTGLGVSGTAWIDGVTLTWQDNAIDEDYYLIEWSDGDGWFVIDEVPANTTSYTDEYPIFGAQQYRVTAGRGNEVVLSASSYLVTVTPIAPPVAWYDDNAGPNDRGTLSPYSTPHDVPLTFNVLLNDVDYDSNVIQIAGYTNPGHGTVTLDPVTGAFTYTPEAGFVGTDTFTYTVADGFVPSAPATVAIDVTNEVPVVLDGRYFYDTWYDVTFEGVVDLPLTGTVHGTDADGDSITFTVVGGPDHGALDLDEETGEFSYQLDGSYYGYDRFLVTAHDGITESLSATIMIVSPGARMTGHYGVHPASGNEDSLRHQVNEIITGPAFGAFPYNPVPRWAYYVGETDLLWGTSMQYKPSTGYTGDDWIIARGNLGPLWSKPYAVRFLGNDSDGLWGSMGYIRYDVSPVEPTSFTAAAMGFHLVDIYGAAWDGTLTLGAQAEHGTVTFSTASALSPLSFGIAYDPPVRLFAGVKRGFHAQGICRSPDGPGT